MKGKTEKLDQFITIGSPIDKIHYFFESRRGMYPIYNPIVDGIRGDIGKVPFTKNGKHHMHWINIWNRVDIISGTLETPNCCKDVDFSVSNVQVSNKIFGDPVRSHSAYFRHPRVMSIMFDAIFFRRYSFQGSKTVEEARKNLESGISRPRTKLSQ